MPAPSVLQSKPWEQPNASRVKLLGPVCVAYGHPNLEETDTYLNDFGLVRDAEQEVDGKRTVYYRGYGVNPVIYIAQQSTAPEFLGVYFEAASEEDLQKAAKVDGASAVKPWLHGGQVVDITDPTGMPFHVVHGFQKRDFTPRENEIEPQNYPAADDRDVAAKPRRGKFHRFTRGSIPVHKLGHCGYITANFSIACAYYCENFNFKPSDILLGKDDSIIICFFHVDLGQDYSDHHSFFLAEPFGPMEPGKPHHAAFEVESIDTNFIGHDFLASKGYKSFWGVGRHVEGSQVFDYWFDLDGFLVEHYADGDLVNEDTPTNIGPFVPGQPWGPPPTMMAPPEP